MRIVKNFWPRGQSYIAIRTGDATASHGETPFPSTPPTRPRFPVGYSDNRDDSHFLLHRVEHGTVSVANPAKCVKIGDRPR